jgi:putative redox protein
MNPKLLLFENQKKLKLAANLYLPLDQSKRFYALFAYCFACTKNFSAVTRICIALSQQGIAVMNFDFIGLGRSEWKFQDSSFYAAAQLESSGGYDHDCGFCLSGRQQSS